MMSPLALGTVRPTMRLLLAFSRPEPILRFDTKRIGRLNEEQFGKTGLLVSR